MIDILHASRFVSEKKATSLISRLKQFCSIHQAAELNRQLLTVNVKSKNQQTMYNVDTIYRAIAADRQISFKYVDYVDSEGEKHYRYGGKVYAASPYHLIYADDQYYLLTYNSEKSRMEHRRVDRMERVTILPVAREGTEEMADFRISDYAEAVFGMFGGQPQAITLRCKPGNEWLYDVLYDRFGTDLHTVPQGDGSFTAHIRAVPSEQFFGWLTGLGAAVRLESPADTAVQYTDYLRGIVEEYFSKN
jgi:predicted DNA-binding transcriptional regulator YafY